MLMHPTMSDLFPARILDLSTGGLKAEVSQFLFAGATLLILRKHTVTIGEVRYCIQSGKGFHAGVSIQDVFDKTQFRL
jgi:hypothetical protein